MLEWMAANGWIVWLIIAAVLLIIEVLTLDLTFLMLSIGAVAAAGASALIGGQPPFEIVVFVGVSLLLLFLVRPRLLLRLNRGPGREGLSNADRLPGQEATVLEPVSQATGLVRLQGDVWTARSASGTFQLGETVLVQRVEGATVVVGREAPHSPSPQTHKA